AVGRRRRLGPGGLGDFVGVELALRLGDFGGAEDEAAGNRGGPGEEIASCLHGMSLSRRRAGHLPLTLKSSKEVRASALVHRPTLPASAKVESFASRCFLPSR